MPMEEDLEVVDSDEDSLEGGGRGRRIGRRGRSGGQDEDEAGDDGLGSEATMENRGDDSELKEIISKRIISESSFRILFRYFFFCTDICSSLKYNV